MKAYWGCWVLRTQMTTRIKCLLPGLDSHILLENSLEILLVRYSGPWDQSLLIHPRAFSQRYMSTSRGQWTPFDSTRPNSESKTLKGSILPLYLGHIPMTQEKDCNTLLVLRENQVRIIQYKGHRCRYLECNWDRDFRLGICKCPVSCPVPSTWTLGDTLYQFIFEPPSQDSSKPRVFGLFSRVERFFPSLLTRDAYVAFLNGLLLFQIVFWVQQKADDKPVWRVRPSFLHDFLYLQASF